MNADHAPRAARRTMRWLAILLLACGAAHAQPSARVEQAGDAIIFRGRIDGPSAAEFLRLLADPRITRLVITSQGGLVDPALDIADAVFARGLDVEVPQLCLSSCANYIVPAARHKRLAGPFVLGWHGNIAHVLYRADIGEEFYTRPVFAEARRLARREAVFFSRIGVDEFVCWFGKIPPYAVDEFYTLSPEDMARFGIAGVSIDDPALPPPRDAEVQRLVVDWAQLEHSRPVVSLGD